MADSAQLDLAERLKSLRSQRVPKGKQLSLIELVEALIPNVNEGLVVVSSCHGLGALLYILMVVVGIPVNMLIVIEKDQRVREWSDGFTRPLLQHIGSKGGKVHYLSDVGDENLYLEVYELLDGRRVGLHAMATCCHMDSPNNQVPGGIPIGVLSSATSGQDTETKRTFWGSLRLQLALEARQGNTPFISEYIGSCSKESTQLRELAYGITPKSIESEYFHGFRKKTNVTSNF